MLEKHFTTVSSNGFNLKISLIIKLIAEFIAFGIYFARSSHRNWILNLPIEIFVAQLISHARR
jgi:hypothetical protein